MAACFVLLMLVLATTSQGAFAISRWSPLALFALAVLIGALLARGGLAAPSLAARVALGGIWGLAAWSMLSMLWAQSSASAFAAGDRTILYAAIATLPFVLPLSRRSLAAAGWALIAGIGAVAVYELIRLIVDGSPVFLAGRLNGPVNYRNATALLFAMPVWPGVVAAAARSYRRGLRAAGLAMATLCLGLAFLTQSRGIVIGLVAGGVIALSLGPDRIRRAWTAVLVLGAVAAASPWLLRPFHAYAGGHGIVTAHEIAVAGEALALTTVAAFAVGLAIALFDNGLRANSPEMRHLRSGARVVLGAGVVIAVVAVLVAIGNPSTYLTRKWDQFRSLQSTTPTSTRLLTTGGQRYDLWRVALKEFDGAPILGVGADNYSFGYYRLRATNRNLDDPHSLVFAVLSENGAVGVVLFILYLGGIAAVIRGGWRRLPGTERRPVAALAATGAVLLGQSTVDWIWLIPGLTAIGVFCAVAGRGPGRRRRPGVRRGPALAARARDPRGRGGDDGGRLAGGAGAVSVRRLHPARPVTGRPARAPSCRRRAPPRLFDPLVGDPALPRGLGDRDAGQPSGRLRAAQRRAVARAPELRDPGRARRLRGPRRVSGRRSQLLPACAGARPARHRPAAAQPDR